jgi:isocitrate lyase
MQTPGLLAQPNERLHVCLGCRALTCAPAMQVGTGYFDAVSTVVTSGASSTLALVGSTEKAQF